MINNILYCSQQLDDLSNKIKNDSKDICHRHQYWMMFRGKDASLTISEQENRMTAVGEFKYKEIFTLVVDNQKNTLFFYNKNDKTSFSIPIKDIQICDLRNKANSIAQSKSSESNQPSYAVLDLGSIILAITNKNTDYQVHIKFQYGGLEERHVLSPYHKGGHLNNIEITDSQLKIINNINRILYQHPLPISDNLSNVTTEILNYIFDKSNLQSSECMKYLHTAPDREKPYIIALFQEAKIKSAELKTFMEAKPDLVSTVKQIIEAPHPPAHNPQQDTGSLGNLGTSKSSIAKFLMERKYVAAFFVVVLVLLGAYFLGQNIWSASSQDQSNNQTEPLQTDSTEPTQEAIAQPEVGDFPRQIWSANSQDQSNSRTEPLETDSIEPNLQTIPEPEISDSSSNFTEDSTEPTQETIAQPEIGDGSSKFAGDDNTQPGTTEPLQ